MAPVCFELTNFLLNIKTPAYELCSSRFCNICLFFEMQKQEKGSLQQTSLPPDKLRYCSNCKLIMYCSPEHQRFDWPIHREFCRNVAKVMKDVDKTHPLRISGQPFDSITMERNIIQLKYLLRIAMKRPLQFHEEELTSFPAHCEICYKFERLHICMVCKGVSYCSPDHEEQDRERHKKICAKLKLYYCPYKLQQQLPPLTLIGDLHRPVRNMLTTDLLGAFQEMTSKHLPPDPTTSMEGYQLFACAGDFSCVGTICFALQFAKILEYTAKKFIIFIVGATIEQNVWFQPIHTKWFFLQYPRIEKLELYFIGPEALGAVDKEVSYPCELLIVDFEVPIVFTSFTKSEAVFDYGALQQVTHVDCMTTNIKRLFDVSLNPYRDVRPLRNWQETHDDPIFYRNNYVQAIITRKR